MCRHSALHLPSKKFTTPVVYILLTAALLNLDVFNSIPLSIWQEIVFHARQTRKQQTNTLSVDIFLLHKRYDLIFGLLRDYFGKGIVFHARQTCKQQTNTLSVTILF